MKQKKEKKQKVFTEDEYEKEQIEWEKTINMTRWEHDFEKKTYTIQYNEK